MSEEKLYSWEDIEKESEENSRKSEYKKFKKEFKKIKKQLIKDAKNFQAWDYDYMLSFIEHSLQAMHLYLSNETLTHQYTSTMWQLDINKLKECYELLKNRNNTDDPLNENKYIAKALIIMSVYIFKWSD